MSENIKYFLYVRKSQESEDRQVQSLDDQINVMKSKADYLWLDIVWTFIESKSAKAPWREEFNNMILQINQWKATGIITWKLDRLSRNPIDTGSVQYMLQTGKINRIITNDREYNPVDAGLLMSVETGMANQYILDLKKNVLRGMNSKYEKGIRPTRVPLWYINNKWERTIEIDPERFPIVRKIWDLMLTWSLTVPKINKIATQEYWLKMRPGKRNTKTNTLSINGTFALFHNIFYTWHYYYKWELIKWIHVPMITLTEYDRVQEILWVRGKTRAKTYEFPFTWMMKCWECGCSITAEIKRKYIKEINQEREYTYYHCSKKSLHMKCTQKSIKAHDLEFQLINLISRIEIIDSFKEWGLGILKSDFEKDSEFITTQIKSLNTAILKEEWELSKLTSLVIRWLIDEEEFLSEKNKYRDSIRKLKQERIKLEEKWDNVWDVTFKIFDFISKMKERFVNGSISDKKLILTTLGKNFVIFDGKVTTELNPWFRVISEDIKDKKWGIGRLEPINKGISILNTDARNEVNTLWFGM